MVRFPLPGALLAGAVLLASCDSGAPSEPEPPIEVAGGSPATGSDPSPGPQEGAGGGAAGPSPLAERLLADMPEPLPDTEKLEEYYEDGRPALVRWVKHQGGGMVNHGPFRRWYPNTVVAEEGFYLEGRKHGPYVLRHEAGNDHSRATYVEGQLDGWLREWDADGQPILEEEYRAGLRHGPHRSWDYLNGDYEEGAYEDDKATGPWEIVTSGTRSEGEFRDGRRRGLWRTWYPEKEGEEPRLQFEEHWVKGRLHGPTTEYGPKGNRLAEYHYAKGSAEGLQTQWYPGGGKKAEWTAKGGEPEGPMQYWFPDGRPQMAGEMRAGKREGKWTFYDIDGSVDEARSGVYEDGVRVSD